MNRSMLYFTQRVLSAATSAAVYVLADVLSQKARQNSYTSNRKINRTTMRTAPNRSISYKDYARTKNNPSYRTEYQPNELSNKAYRSMNQQAMERRKKGTDTHVYGRRKSIS